MTELRIGIDLGGTKTEVIALNTQSEELYRKRIATVSGDYARTLESIADLVSQVESATGENNIPVGVGIPGTISKKTGCVKNANSTWINDKPMQQDLSRRLDRDVKVTNDANCLAISEATDGAGKGFNMVFAGILGTGCGAGIAYERRPIVGPNGVAGEWGHNPLPWTTSAELNARPCYCGQFGCQEAFLSGTGLSLSYYLESKEHITGQELMARANAGEPAACRVLDRYMEQLARGLAAIINILDPDVIVLGGGASNIKAIYDVVPKRLSKYVFGGECDTPIKQAIHGDSSGVRGAAWLNPA